MCDKCVCYDESVSDDQYLQRIQCQQEQQQDELERKIAECYKLLEEISSAKCLTELFNYIWNNNKYLYEEILFK